jgi:hypothetical protein
MQCFQQRVGPLGCIVQALSSALFAMNFIAVFLPQGAVFPPHESGKASCPLRATALFLFALLVPEERLLLSCE